MPSRVPVSALKKLADEHGLLTAVLHGWDGTLQHIVTYGSTVENCDFAAQAGTIMEKAFEWPDMEERLPSRVRKLKAQVAELNVRLAERTRHLLAELDGERKARQAGLAHWPIVPNNQHYPVGIIAVTRDERPPGSDAVDFEVRKATREEREAEYHLHQAGKCPHTIRQSVLDPSRCWTCQVVGLPVVVTMSTVSP